MADENSKRYMELQMEELKTMVGDDVEPKRDDVKSRSGRPEDAEIAGLYADAAEYEEELEKFERELEAIKNSTLSELVDVLTDAFPGEEQNYDQELKAVVESSWKKRVEEDQTHPAAHLEVIRTTPFGALASKMAEAFPDYEGDFEAELKQMLLQRWELYIEIKKEHIKEETSYIKTLGLKPHYAKKVYKRYHGIA